MVSWTSSLTRRQQHAILQQRKDEGRAKKNKNPHGDNMETGENNTDT